MTLPRYEVFPSADGYRWRLRAKNGKITAQSEGHPTKANAKRGALTSWRVGRRTQGRVVEVDA